MCKNVIQVYENVIQVYIFAHKNKGVQKGGKCSAMYFNLYSTFPSAICYPFHFTWFLLLLSVPRCHSLEHFAMDLATFQHILEERGLQSIAVRAQQHHADKWLSLLCTEDTSGTVGHSIVVLRGRYPGIPLCSGRRRDPGETLRRRRDLRGARGWTPVPSHIPPGGQ